MYCCKTNRYTHHTHDHHTTHQHTPHTHKHKHHHRNTNTTAKQQRHGLSNSSTTTNNDQDGGDAGNRTRPNFQTLRSKRSTHTTPACALYNNNTTTTTPEQQQHTCHTQHTPKQSRYHRSTALRLRLSGQRNVVVPREKHAPQIHPTKCGAITKTRRDYSSKTLLFDTCCETDTHTHHGHQIERERVQARAARRGHTINNELQQRATNAHAHGHARARGQPCPWACACSWPRSAAHFIVSRSRLEAFEGGKTQSTLQTLGTLNEASSCCCCGATRRTRHVRARQAYCCMRASAGRRASHWSAASRVRVGEEGGVHEPVTISITCREGGGGGVELKCCCCTRTGEETVGGERGPSHPRG